MYDDKISNGEELKKIELASAPPDVAPTVEASAPLQVEEPTPGYTDTTGKQLTKYNTRAKTNALGLLKADRKTIAKYGEDHIKNGKKISDLENEGAQNAHEGDYNINSPQSFDQEDIDRHQREIEYLKRKADQTSYDLRNYKKYDNEDTEGMNRKDYENLKKSQKDNRSINLMVKIEDKIKKTKKFRRDLREKIASGNPSGGVTLSDLKSKLTRVNHHIKHLEREKNEAENKEIIEDENNRTFGERVKNLFTSDTSKAFVFFCAISAFVFTMTAFLAVADKEYLATGKDIKKLSDSLIGFGISYFVIFSILLSVSFGKKKQAGQKIASLCLLVGSFYMGLFFIYLFYKGNITDLGPGEKLASSIAVLVTFLFISFSICYDLFSKETTSTGEILQYIYFALSIVSFLAMGGIITYLTFEGNYKNRENLALLFPLSTGLFFVGIIALLCLLLTLAKSVDIAISETLNTGLKLIESTKIKIAIMASFFMTIYYTYLMYYSFTNDKVSGDNLPKDKLDFRDKVIKNNFYAGIGLISLFLITMGVSFGGTLFEKLFSTLLVVFLTFIGTLFIYFDVENKIQNLEKYEKDMLLASEIIFGILLFVATWYVLFKSKLKSEESLSVLSRLIITLASVVFFVYFFAIICSIIFWYWPGGLLKAPGEIWAAFGIGILVFAFFIYAIV